MNDGVDLLGGQILRSDIGIDGGRLENALGMTRANSINVAKRSFDALLAGDFYSK